jgi:outer membrane protein OmpA-like peptidoglycan-associated protein
MRNGLKRLAIAAATALICYALLGFLILPGLAQRIANQQLAVYASVPASLARMEFNPFSLELDVFALSLGTAEQHDVGFDHLYVDLSWDSLFRRTLHLSEVHLEAPRAQLRFAKDGTFNLAQLFRAPEQKSEPETPAAEGEIFPLQLDRFRLSAGQLRFIDKRPSEPIDLLYDELNLELHNLVTREDGAADATLAASGPSGGHIDWQGQLNLAPLRSSGSLTVDSVALADFWPYVRDAAPLALERGTLSASTRYELDLSEALQLRLLDLDATLAPLAINDLQGNPLVRLERLEVAETKLDLADKRLQIGKVRSAGLETWVIREQDGALNWQRLFAEPTATDGKTPAAQPSEPAWQIQLSEAQLADYRIHLTDRVPEQEVALELAPLKLTLRQFDSQAKTPFKVDLDTGIGRQGNLQATGELQLAPLSGRLDVRTRDLDLRVAQAYLAPFIRLELRSGMLSSDLQLTLDGAEPLAFSATGTAEITQLHTLDTLKDRDFVKWQRLRLEGIDYQHQPQRLAIETVDIDQPYARFIINPDLSTNVNELLVDQPGEPAAAAPAGPASAPLALHIGGIRLTDGSANFADFSLRPPFATAIQDLDGHIGTLDNQQQPAAPVDITGKVDRYAPVAIKGSLTPFDPLQRLDIATSFRQVELTTLTPYSSKFAGYRIRKGRLNLDLHYRIQQGQLDAQNRVVLEQLQLGEKVDSPDAVDLPVRLAVALLKDTHGTIDIKLPVQGNLNDPQFSVMPIIWQTLRNLVLRAAQAPFKFLAGLVDGGQEDLSQIAFAPASSELDAQARANLKALAQALQQRPQLVLEVEGRSAASEGRALAEQRLEREYQRTFYRVLQRRGEKVPGSEDELVVADDEKPALLEGIYRSRLGRQPPEQWRELEEDARAQQLREAVIDSWSSSAILLRNLARERAATIKNQLTDLGLDPQRVYLLDTSTIDAQPDGEITVVLHLGSE